MIKRMLSPALVSGILLVASMAGAQTGQNSPEIKAADIRQYITRLASDEWQGRKPGTPGGNASATYIRDYFGAQKLELLFNDGFQPFSLITEATAGDKNKISINGTPCAEIPVPYSFSASTTVNAPVLFAGYGFDLSNDTLKWNDFDGLNVKGNWVLLFRGDPDPDNSESAYVSSSDERTKVLAAKDRGAAGVLFVSGESFDKEDKPARVFYDKSNADAGLPVLWISRKTAGALFAESGTTLSETEKALIAGRQPVKVDLKTVVEATSDVRLKKAETMNVVAMLRGSNPALSDEYVVIGAHYDHLGMGGYGSGSRIPDTIAVHNGADDNASGVAAMMELAAYFASQKVAPARSIIFVAFGAEESGIIGSAWFVQHPPVEIKKIKSMVNFDMVGRLNSETKSLSIGGTGTSVEGEAILNEILAGSSLKASFSPEGYGPSDHASFYGRNIPVFYFNTGVHTDYHTPFDDADKINYEGEQLVVELSARLIDRLTQPATSLAFKEAGAAKRGSMRGLKVTFGIMPDFTSTEGKGLGVSGVTPGGPAEKAGLKKGDRIMAIEGKDVTDIYDYMNRLKKLEKGSRVSVDILRAGKTEVFIIQL
ncbi:MAG TPA: hypothetical protein DEO70_11470 [Bacteroidales bacterium]|nr:MAG: hypothetical protein A2X11_05300 [Bacteroidetes bacterium GWE2_42_24]HBZ67445.1 hypothetical protein [Bacteroidales bacterium]